MTAFILAWTPPGTVLDPRVAPSLRAALEPAGTLVGIDTPRCSVAVWDSGLWPGPSLLTDAGAGVVVAGDPVVRVGALALDRETAVADFLGKLPADAGALLREAEGTYACAAWNSNGGVVVATDKLGVRPVYWARVGNCVYVSTVQWALERITAIPRDEDLRGTIESSLFGFPLGNRTCRSAIQVLGAGELLDLGGDAPQITRYWDWTALQPSDVAEGDLAAHILAGFRDAVAARLHGRDRVFAFLSGGMDSRLIVSQLRQLEVPVSSINFAPPGSQDLLYGRLAAQAAHTQHFEFPEGGTDFAVRRNTALHTWDDDPRRRELRPARPGLVWSGDGGSVGLGHVYLDLASVERARAGDTPGTARAIQAACQLTLSPRSFNRAHRELVDLPFQGICEDLSSRTVSDPGRNVHLFFMLNDQRRHLMAHFESLHVHRIDLVLPFFDGRFLSAVLSSALDPFLLHRLYNDIMTLLPFGLGQVPWQAYPGHVPCPVQSASDARHQWGEGWYASDHVRRVRRAQMRSLLRLALSREFPSDVLSRPNLLLAALVGATGSPRLGYLWNPAQALVKVRGGVAKAGD